LQKNGAVVASNDTYVISRYEMHNNWNLITAVKRGGTISVRIWDNEILRYEDPDPIASGGVSMGTLNNGVIIPRVTVWGTPTG